MRRIILDKIRVMDVFHVEMKLDERCNLFECSY